MDLIFCSSLTFQELADSGFKYLIKNTAEFSSPQRGTISKFLKKYKPYTSLQLYLHTSTELLVIQIGFSKFSDFKFYV